MRKTGRIVALMALVMMVLTLCGGCRKIGINGDLDGQWRVLSIENTESGETLQPDNVFYCMYLHTVNLTGGSVGATGNMTYTGSMLTFEFPAVESVDVLKRWGIYSIRTEFEVERLTGSHLVIKSDAARITLAKF